eukprot:tig00020816_g14189.t1
MNAYACGPDADLDADAGAAAATSAALERRQRLLAPTFLVWVSYLFFAVSFALQRRAGSVQAAAHFSAFWMPLAAALNAALCLKWVRGGRVVLPSLAFTLLNLAVVGASRSR